MGKISRIILGTLWNLGSRITITMMYSIKTIPPPIWLRNISCVFIYFLTHEMTNLKCDILKFEIYSFIFNKLQRITWHIINNNICLWRGYKRNIRENIVTFFPFPCIILFYFFVLTRANRTPKMFGFVSDFFSLPVRKIGPCSCSVFRHESINQHVQNVGCFLGTLKVYSVSLLQISHNPP